MGAVIIGGGGLSSNSTAANRRPTHGPRRLFSGDGNGGNNTAKTCFFKLEMEAPFFRVRPIISSLSTAACSGWKIIVSSTEAVTRTTQSDRYVPRSGGAYFNVPVGQGNDSTTSPFGWRTCTFAGSASGTTPAATNTRMSYLVGDWIECTSMPRLDGSGRHYLLARIYNPAATSNTIMSGPVSSTGVDAWNNQAALNPVPAWFREFRNAVVNSQDGVGTLTNMPSGDYGGSDWPFMVDFEVDYGVPTRSFYAAADSTWASGGFQPYDYDQWLWRAVGSLSTPSSPMVAFNGAKSSQRSSVFMDYFPDILATGLAPTDVIIPIGSPNDSSIAPANTETAFNTSMTRARVLDHLDRCAAIGARPYIATRIPNDLYSGANEAQRIAQNVWARGICASGRATLIDFDAATSNGASPARFKSGMRGDDFHQNAVGIQAMADVAALAFAS